MRSELSIDELAECAGETPGDVLGWQRDGLLSEAGLNLRDVERVRLIRALERRGLSYELIVAAFRDHCAVIESFLDEFSIPDVNEVSSAAEELARLDFDAALLELVLGAGNLHDATTEPTFEDIAALRTVRFALHGGFPEDALLQLIRVFRDALGRVADAEVRLFHIHVHQGLYAQGLRGADLAAATNAAGKGMAELIEPTLLYFHRKAWKDALRDDLVLHVLEELGIGEPDGAEGRLWRAVVFTDLSSFTPLTDVMGDTTAATLLDRFSTRVRAITRSTSGTVVKQIGDSFMTVFLNAGSAVTATLELLHQLSDEPQFPAIHAGIHYGPLLYREGDYVGGSVNVAARLLTEAGPNEIVVSGPARRDTTQEHWPMLTSNPRAFVRSRDSQTRLRYSRHTTPITPYRRARRTRYAACNYGTRRSRPGPPSAQRSTCSARRPAWDSSPRNKPPDTRTLGVSWSGARYGRG